MHERFPPKTVVAAVGSSAAVWFLIAGCFSERPAQCQRNSDCDTVGGGICSVAGFCEVQCSPQVPEPALPDAAADVGVQAVKSSDCPLGSFCAAGCRVCIRVDHAGPADCFGERQGLTRDQLLGACQSGISAHVETPLDMPLPQCGVDAATSATGADSGGSRDAQGDVRVEDAGIADASVVDASAEASK